MERFVNIMIIEQDDAVRNRLKKLLLGGGNNILSVKTIKDALPIIDQKEIGIYLVDIDDSLNGETNLKSIKDRSQFKNHYIILLTKENSESVNLVKGMHQGAVDFITYPFQENIIKSKIEVYKTLYFKDQRIGQLLNNIFPENVLSELSSNGKFSPKRIENGVVLFTDFVDFSLKSKMLNPLRLIHQLERYFIKFDEIVTRYNLEKIKTIGDAYMALAGVTENKPEPAVRACLAAIEIRDYIQTERDIALATKTDFWEIRIGLHMGPLVAGIIGTNKYNFDVWGDTVNIAARAEASTKRGTITITSNVFEKIEPYFDTVTRGKVDILKRGGAIDMYFLQNLKREFGMYSEGNAPKSALRIQCGLPSVDFKNLRTHILNQLKSLLPQYLIYHDLPHTIDVEKAVIRYANLEGISKEDLILLRTAALFHDAGFILQYHKNEDIGIGMVRSALPKYGYTNNQIDKIVQIINATKLSVEPSSLLEQIMCDADHDYIGRPEYHIIAKKLREELALNKKVFTEREWIEFQLEFLENQHVYYTETANNIRSISKNKRIKELKKQLKKLND
jgi:adenylate cyclase